MTGEECVKALKEKLYGDSKDILETTCDLWFSMVADSVEKLVNQAVEYYKNEVIKEMKEAKFPIIDLKMGVKINGIQQTDDAVLYERALEILESVPSILNGN